MSELHNVDPDRLVRLRCLEMAGRFGVESEKIVRLAREMYDFATEGPVTSHRQSAQSGASQT